MNPEHRNTVLRALEFLEDDMFRREHGIDLVLLTEGIPVWACTIGRAWISYVQQDDEVTVLWLSIRSRFRPF